MLDLLEESNARLSACGRYRYQLSRKWGSGSIACFVMLNPSTADASEDDPTIRRCKNFAKRENCGGLVVANLYAHRATDPAMLIDDEEHIGPGNDVMIRDAILAAEHTDGPVIAAWGAHPIATKRAKWVSTFAEFKCLGKTAKGAPRHPLYLRKDAKLIPLVSN